MKKFILLFVLVANFNASQACLNYIYSLDNSGHFHDAEDLRRAFNTNFDVKKLDVQLKKLETKLKTNKDYRILSDYGVLLLKVGRTTEAVDIFEQLSLKYPNMYEIAANLGTAYELAGNVEKALEFIKRGVELNPNAHGGSEWVHVKLLEAKLKIQKDKAYLDKHTVLNLSEKQKKDVKVRDQLMIQIRERFPFCKGPDPIMASLMVDLGDCYAHTASIEFAKASYEIALHYYGIKKEIADPKITEMKELLRQFTNLSVSDRSQIPNGENNHFGMEGEHNRISVINYKKLLDDNNPSNYKIDWSKLQINVDTLLAYAEIERVIPEPIEVKKVEVKAKAKRKKSSEEGKNNLWMYLVVGGACLAGVAYFLLKKKR